jgi:hypothetical protein
MALRFILHEGKLDALGQAILKLGNERQDLVSRNTLHDLDLDVRSRTLTEGIFDTKTKGFSLPRCPLTCRDNYCRRASMPHCRSDLHKENGEDAKNVVDQATQPTFSSATTLIIVSRPLPQSGKHQKVPQQIENLALWSRSISR